MANSGKYVQMCKGADVQIKKLNIETVYYVDELQNFLSSICTSANLHICTSLSRIRPESFLPDKQHFSQ